MSPPPPFFNKAVTLQKFPMKGGWTYAKVDRPSVKAVKAFGMLKVRGTIDHLGFEGLHLMPMGDGSLFFPVKAAYRKQLQKGVGDTVHLVLWLDDAPLPMPDILKALLEEDQTLAKRFDVLDAKTQQDYFNKLHKAKGEAAALAILDKLIHDLENR